MDFLKSDFILLLKHGIFSSSVLMKTYLIFNDLKNGFICLFLRHFRIMLEGMVSL